MSFPSLPLRPVRPTQVGLALALLLALIPSPHARAASPPERTGPQVMAFYYTWYGTPSGGAWRHWDEGGHHPDRRTPAGLWDVGATDHPETPYDSHDPATIRRHLDEAEEAGIDVLLPTWWAKGDWHDEAYAQVLRETEARLAKGEKSVRLAPHYEVVPLSASDPVSAASDDFLYLLNTYGDSPATFRHDGKPVIFVYSRAVGQLPPGLWREVIRRVKAQKPAFIVGDSTDPEMYGVFDTLFEYNPVGAVVQGEPMGPRDARLVKDARSHGRVSSLTVIPGYDDSHIGRTTPIIAPREKGLLYQRLWNAALDAKPDWVLITSFNEWHEGSEIEPSAEYENQFLLLTRDFGWMFHRSASVFARLMSSGGDFEMERDRLRLTGGTIIEPLFGSRLTAIDPHWRTIQNRSGGVGGMRVRLPNGEEPYVFELGRDDKRWRVLSPASPDGRNGYEYRLRPQATVKVESPKDLALDPSAGPYAAMARLRLHLDLASESPAPNPQQWQVYPGGAIPIRATLRNAGTSTLTGGGAELWVPEGWGGGRKRLFSRLRPGQSAIAVLTARPSALAALGRPSPAFVFVRFRAEEKAPTQDGSRVSFQNSVDLVPVRPVDAAFAFGPSGETRVHLRNLFPKRTLKGTVTLRTAEGRTVEEKERRFRVRSDARLTFHQRIPANEPPALRRTYATITIGGYRQLASAVDMATVALGPTNDAAGVEWINWDDGRTGPVTNANGPARRAIPHLPDQPHYMYFNVTPGLPTDGPTYVHLEYFDAGTGSFRLQYDSTDENALLSGRYKDAEAVLLANTGTWKRHTWTLNDARLAGRQNGGADFRLAFGPETAILRRVTVSKWP